MTKRLASGLLPLFLLWTGCTVGPNYKRPVVTVPPVYRGENAEQLANQSAPSLGDEKWWLVFHDTELQKLIHVALQQNFDVRIAASRILQAEAQLGITRADQFPNITGGPSYTAQKIPLFKYQAAQAQASLSWIPDFWGRYRRATEAARANLLASEWNKRTVIETLVSNLAAAYFQLREFDLELDISQRTLVSRRNSLQLTETLANGGATSLLDVKQAQQLVETAAAAIPDIQRQITETEDAINLYLGASPNDVTRGKPLTEQSLPATIPTGLPSRLLERRPDIRQAEQSLVAANAQIGVARAQLFPEISLTGSGGIASLALSNVIGVYTATPTVTEPIFNAGQLRSNVRLAEAGRQEAVLTYHQAIYTALRQVSDSLAGYQRFREFREHQESLTAAARDASGLSEMRYKGGVTSYLEVLTNETNYFSAELNLARARLSERLSLVQVYNALGGGWEQ
ncbi:MAG TPA: efflux transporter outer membrane subunit [Bryobacteraceae bacterium]|nr:efflux transporter outer membrane subunit [Bryobacteraceae bacterium]